MSTTSEIELWTKQLEAAKKNRDRAITQLEMHMAAMKQTFSVDTPEQLEELIQRLTEKRDKLQAEFTSNLNNFREKYAERLAEAAK
jgi:hypothetical protein